MDKTPVTIQAPEKRRFPRGTAKLWQLGICLLLFIAALFFRAFSDKDTGSLFAGATSLRELAAQAGQALGRSELAEAFARGFREAYTGASEATETATTQAATTQATAAVMTKQAPAATTVAGALADDALVASAARATATVAATTATSATVTATTTAAAATTAATTAAQTTVALPKPGILPDTVTTDAVAIDFPYVLPVSGRVTSPFGYRIHPVDDVESFHYGIDIAAAEGTDICAFADGKVIYAGTGEINGKYMKIEHADGFVSLYAHLSALEVCVGDMVAAGQVIARSGATGKVTGPHLHFQLYHDGLIFDPLTVLGGLIET
ncbi:MAG: M23 family metallopeptidase [Clostridiaceae bacterium]|nr:M23 family metallopeptidase [Clostridiaceae bacterium]